MPEITVDITGITSGQTLIWDSATSKFVAGNRLAGSVPRTATTISALGDGVFDGEQAILRVGTYPNIHEEPLTWSNTQDKWFGSEHILVTQGDAWAMDLGNRSQAQLEVYTAIDNPVPYGQAFAVIDGSLNLSDSSFNNDGSPTGVIPVVDDTLSSHSYPFIDAGAVVGSPMQGTYYRIRDNYLIGEVNATNDGFENCAVVQGSRGTIPNGEYIRQGWPGGWGFSVVPVAFADDLWAAGLHLQERLMSLMNCAPDAGSGERTLQIAPYWYQYDPGDGGMNVAVPLTGGMGTSAVLTSLADTGGDIVAERPFFMTSNDWSDWPLATPTKTFLLPRLAGKMETGSETSGSCLDTRLGVRWAS